MWVWVAFSATCGRGLSSSAKEAVEEDEQDGGADGDVELVSLAGESGDAEDDAEDWRGDEEDESELDDAGGVEMGCGLEESGRLGNGRGLEVGVVGGGGGDVAQREDAADERRRRRRG